MFILKRQDVEISSIQHPKRDQKIPILTYQGITFRLISVFHANQEEEARALWRDLTDNQGKACVLLEEPDRYSIWGKVRLDQLTHETQDEASSSTTPMFTQACLLMLQAMYVDIEDLMGTKQAVAFQKAMADVFRQGRVPQTDSPDDIKQLLTVNPLDSLQTPTWQENHLIVLLQELHRIGKSYFGKSPFIPRILEALQDLPSGERLRFLDWMTRSPSGNLWR